MQNISLKKDYKLQGWIPNCAGCSKNIKFQKIRRIYKLSACNSCEVGTKAICLIHQFLTDS